MMGRVLSKKTFSHQGAMHCGADGAGGCDVIVLDHDHVVEADAVVDPAADQHCPLV
jgi:hypothetical protein